MIDRPKRVGELIREKVSTILRKKVADPRIGFVSVTDVVLSKDLKNAKVFVSIYGTDKDKRDTMRGITSAKGYIQGELGRSIDLRYTPNLRFIEDKAIERGSRMMVIMSKLEREATESKKIHGQQQRTKKRR